MSKNITKKIKRIMGGEYPVGFAKKGTDLNDDQKDNAIRNLLNKFKFKKNYPGLEKALDQVEIVKLVNDWEEGDYKKATERIIKAIPIDASGNAIDVQLQPVLDEAKSAKTTFFGYWGRITEPNPNKVPTKLSEAAKEAEEQKNLKEQQDAAEESDVKPNEKNYLLNVPIKIIESSDKNSINGIYISKPIVEKNVGINFVKENPIRVDKNSVNFLKKENIISLLPDDDTKNKIVNAYNNQWENVSSDLRDSGRLGYAWRGLKAPFVSTVADIYKAKVVNADILRYRNSAESTKNDNKDLNTRINELELFVRKNGDEWYNKARSDSDKSPDFKYFKIWTELRNKVTFGPAKIVEKEAAEVAIDNLIEKINADDKSSDVNYINNKDTLKKELENLKNNMLPSDYANIVKNLTESKYNPIGITPEGYVKTNSGTWTKIPDFISKIRKSVNILGGKTRKHKKSKTQKAGRKNKKTMKH